MQDLIEQIKDLEANGELNPRRGLKLVYLRKAMKFSGMPQCDFAEVLDINVSTLRRYENASIGPLGIDNAIRIARYLGLRLEDITSGEALEEYANQPLSERHSSRPNKSKSTVSARIRPSAPSEPMGETPNFNPGDVLGTSEAVEEAVAKNFSALLESRIKELEERVRDLKENRKGFFRKIFS